MSLVGRLRSLMPVAGLLIAMALLLRFSPSAVMLPVLGGLVLFLALLWLLFPAAYDRLHARTGRALQAVSMLFTLLVLLVAYFLLLTPIALLMRWMGRDPLSCQPHSLAASNGWRSPHSRQYDDEFFRAQF